MIGTKLTTGDVIHIVTSTKKHLMGELEKKAKKIKEDIITELLKNQKYADELFDILERNGIVWRGIIEIGKDFGHPNLPLDSFMQELGNHMERQGTFKTFEDMAKFRVTVVIDPLEKP